MALYKFTLTSKTKTIQDHSEYIRAKSKKMVALMIEQCFVIKGSTYYGYDNYTIRSMKISDFPELRSIRV